METAPDRSSILRFPPLIAWALAAGLGLIAIWMAQLFFSARQENAELENQIRLATVQEQLLENRVEELTILNSRLTAELKQAQVPPGPGRR